ncbi:amidohydrolase [archaeon]|nr:amidohydrolase [archaeon]MBL7056776.1 amidohydrolase [Candidatus Woesearchaeota archaeon]
MSILIKNVLLNNKKKDIFIQDNKISEIKNKIIHEAEFKIDGSGKAVIPSFVNAHTHAAMTLFRGYADDLQLNEWLKKKIWPNELRLTEKRVYIGTKLACLEMIKSGTTYFNDMYFRFGSSAQAVKDMGMRACINTALTDFLGRFQGKMMIKKNLKLYEKYKDFNPKMQISSGAHSIYTISQEFLEWMRDFTEEKDILIHFHISETEKEVKDCVKKHKMRPVEYLDSIGFLSRRLVAAHCVWVNEKEVRILAKRNVQVVHNPVSNLKLAINKIFPYQLYKKYGSNVCLGTDGAASNNSLSMFNTMKTAALIQKYSHNDPRVLPADECLKLATLNGFKCFGLDGGIIKEGKLADLLLIDLKVPEMVPNHNLVSNIVYSGNASCVDTTICDGKILMQNRKVKGEEEILEAARITAKKFLRW